MSGDWVNKAKNALMSLLCSEQVKLSEKVQTNYYTVSGVTGEKQ